MQTINILDPALAQTHPQLFHWRQQLQSAGYNDPQIQSYFHQQCAAQQQQAASQQQQQAATQQQQQQQAATQHPPPQQQQQPQHTAHHHQQHPHPHQQQHQPHPHQQQQPQPQQPQQQAQPPQPSTSQQQQQQQQMNSQTQQQQQQQHQKLQMARNILNAYNGQVTLNQVMAMDFARVQQLHDEIVQRLNHQQQAMSVAAAAAKQSVANPLQAMGGVGVDMNLGGASGGGGGEPQFDGENPIDIMLVLLHQYPQIDRWLQSMEYHDTATSSRRHAVQFLTSLMDSQPQFRHLIGLIQNQLKGRRADENGGGGGGVAGGPSDMNLAAVAAAVQMTLKQRRATGNDSTEEEETVTETNASRSANNLSGSGVVPFPTGMTRSEAMNLQVGDTIDHRDDHDVGRFFLASVKKKTGTNCKIHYIGWPRRWETWSDFNTELHRFAKAGLISRRLAHRFKAFKKGDWVDINPSLRHPGWKMGEIRRLDRHSGQVQVVYAAEGKNYVYWTHLDNVQEIDEFHSKTQKQGSDADCDEGKDDDGAAVSHQLDDLDRKGKGKKRALNDNIGESKPKRQKTSHPNKADFVNCDDALAPGKDSDLAAKKRQQQQLQELEHKNEVLGKERAEMKNELQAMQKQNKKLEAQLEDLQPLKIYGDDLDFGELEQQTLSAMENKLEEKLKSIKQAKQNMTICIVCQDAPRDHVFVPCGHFCVCGDCKQHYQGGDTECPICRKKVSDVMQMFHA